MGCDDVVIPRLLINSVRMVLYSDAFNVEGAKRSAYSRTVTGRNDAGLYFSPSSNLCKIRMI
jgi:hypothetical protein